MKSKLIERIRFLVICAILIAVGIFLLNRYPPTGDIIKILPDDNATRTLTLYNKFESSKKLFVLVHGFEEDSLEKATRIKAILERQKSVESVFFNVTDVSPRVQSYLADNYYYLSDFNATPLSSQSIQQRLNESAQSILSGGAYVSLDTQDPLHLFTQMQIIAATMKDGFLVVPGKGYCLIASVSPSISDMEASRRMYDEVNGALAEYKNDIVVFSPNFYSVENSAFIKNDIENITIFTFVILLGVYFFLLRNRTLLIFSVTTLVVSAIIALIAVKGIFGDVSILVVAFGAGIASIAEDYLFMLFINDDYRHHRFNKPVFYGFIATEAGLLSLVWIDFPLIAQLALFAAISLAISYVIFAFFFRRLAFYQNERSEKSNAIYLRLFALRRIPPVVFLVVSLAMMAYALPRISFDPNFRHLDYQNQKLMAAEALFNETLGGDKIPVLISAKTMEELLVDAEQFRAAVPKSFSIANLSVSQHKAQIREAQIRSFDFEHLNKELETFGVSAGFRSGTFAESYNGLSHLPPYRMDEGAIAQLGVEVLRHDGVISTIGYMDEADLGKLSGLGFAKPIIGRELLSQSAMAALEQFKSFFLVASLALLLIVAMVTKREALYALNFLLFPVASILCMLSFLEGYTIMHLFALFLMMIYGIDYGIFLAKGSSVTSMRAVIYSSITTFAGFGILFFSKVPAVYAIGESTLVGLAAIVLLFFQKNTKGA